MTNNISGGSVVWNLDIDKKAFDTKIDQSESQAKEFANKVNKLDFRQVAQNAAGHFDRIAASIQRTTVIAAGLGIGIGSIFIKSAADLEQTSRSFEVLTGNAEVARKLFADLKSFADKTPFEFPDLAKGAQALLGFGRSADQAFKDIKVLGDIAAATGADFNSLAVVFGQVNATGRLMGQDALQLINNNIPITTLLAKDLGISVQEVKERMEEGTISADIFNTSLQNSAKEGGFAFQGTDKLATTLNGRLSTLKDTVLEFGRNLLGVKVDPKLGFVVEPGGIFDRFSLLVPKITAALIEFTPHIVAAFGWIIDHGDLIIAAIVGITAALIAAKVAAIALNILALSPLGLIITAIIVGIGLMAAGAYLLIKNWQAVKDFFIGLGKSIADFFVAAGSLLYNAGKALIGGLVNGLVAAKNAVVDTIKNIANGALDTIKKFFGIRSPSTVMAEQGKFLMQGLAKGITGNVSSVTGAMQSASQEVMGQFGSVSGSNGVSLANDVSGDVSSPGDSKVTTIFVNPNFKGIVARSRSEWRDIVADGIEAVNEDLRSRGLEQIGGGKIVGTSNV